MPPSILVIEDDELTRETLAVILKAKNYLVTNASSVDQAVSVLKNRHFDVLVMAGKLLGKDQTKLQSVENFASNTIKIVLTAYPSAISTIEALTLGVDAYIIKPIDPDELLKTIQKKLDEILLTRDAEAYGDKATSKPGKVPMFGSEDFQHYLETMAQELVDFGLTVNQAKVYVTLVTAEAASASQIASYCGIRREEVYRILPALLEMGAVSKKNGNPLKYSAVSPENAMQQLMKVKLGKAAQELNSLNTKRDVLIKRLKKTETPITSNIKSVEILTNLDFFYDRFLKANQRVEKSIDAIMSSDILHYTQINMGELLKKFRNQGVKCRIVTEGKSFKSQLSHLKGAADPQFQFYDHSGLFSLRIMASLPYNAVVLDDREAFYGNLNFRDQETNVWSNLPCHVEIVKAAFENLWQKAKLLPET